MILKQLYIDINRDETVSGEMDNDYRYGLFKESRHICNFIEREVLKKAKFKTENYNRVVFSLTMREHPDELWVNSEKVLIVNVPFNKSAYDSSDTTLKKKRFLVEVIELGLGMMKKNGYEFPYDEILSSLKFVLRDGFENEWIHKKKKSKNYGLVALLRCKLGIFSFRLVLEVLNSEGEVLFVKELLNTDPDENAYQYKFKDILWEDRRIVITSRYSEPLFEKDVQDIFIES